ncbi:Peptidoglycan binding domain protein [hydrothermal vent metagenome]|uniref:Peptidoglycan binding domain protein n=1 Tax=hydrothermal vent metagenome TaxID=652676 RepID=A0A3B0Y097_9ZZZZ
MKKRIVICADGTWNRPEKDLDKDFPTNVLKLARAIKPVGTDQAPQQIFYDWGIGSYYAKVSGGTTGKGIDKNIMDDYRYIVQNYAPGDELFLFGFSRGAYTVRALCGMINNIGILKRADAKLIQQGFDHYKKSGKKYSPKGEKSVSFRREHSHSKREIAFAGVWDTVGALGIPFSFLGLLDRKDEFYDNKMGPIIKVARHAMAIDELRSDFEPTVWEPRAGVDLKQVWFSGVHSNIGGSYAPDKNGGLASDYALDWMMREAQKAGLAFEPHLRKGLEMKPDATLHNSRKLIYRSKSPYYRPIDHGKGEVLMHKSVKERWESDAKYRPKNLKTYFKANNNAWPKLVG